MWQSGSAIAVVITLDGAGTTLCHTWGKAKVQACIVQQAKRKFQTLYLLANN
jgi:hypothetical protein